MCGPILRPMDIVLTEHVASRVRHSLSAGDDDHWDKTNVKYVSIMSTVIVLKGKGTE